MNPYASERPTGYPSREDLSGTTDSCSVCRADGIAISDDGLCAECAPGEEETCEDYAARVRKIRATCLCSAPATSPVSVPTGRCPIHGFAWRYPR